MKQFLLTLLLTFAVGIGYAQTEHMKFKGFLWKELYNPLQIN